MNFLSSAVDLIRRKKNAENNASVENTVNSTIPNSSMELDFSIRNYAKESFSVLIVKPFSGYILKIMKATSFLITGVLVGAVVAIIGFGILMQFGSVENTILSSIIISKMEKMLPDSDLSIKSATLQWNSDINSMEIHMKKIRVDDVLIPRISIVPDYIKSIKEQKLIAKTVSVINPKINIDISDSFRTISFNPNLEKGGKNKMFFEPISSLNGFIGILDNDSLLKLLNAQVSISEDGMFWELKNVFYEHKVGQTLPRAIDFSVDFPEQKYSSNISMSLAENFQTPTGKFTYNLKIGSLNPAVVNKALSKRNTPAFQEAFSLVNGHNIPISGNLQLNFENKKIVGGKFDLVAAGGSIKLPVKNILSPNLGKRIDNGSISGLFSENNIIINSVNVSYGNAGFQLTGVSIPMNEYRLLDVANVDGTISLSNISVQEMSTMLPESITKSIVPAFNNYLPGFKLELFKIDLKGPIAFGDRSGGNELSIGQGIFKINNAKIPLGEHVVSNISATGVIASDGLDIRISNAQFRDTKINDGAFFISNKDNSWIGKVNADIAVNEISSFAKGTAGKLSSLPLEKLNIKGTANLDMKLVRIEGDKMLSKDLPFRIVDVDGKISSDNNTKELKLAWNDSHLFVKGDVSTGKNKINILLEEDLKNNSGNSSFVFSSNSDFLNSLIPDVERYCSGDFRMKIDGSWGGKKEEFDIRMDLKNATLNIPAIGDLKLKKDDGILSIHAIKKENGFELSNVLLDTKNNKIKGKIDIDKDGNVLKCVLDEFQTNGCSAKINLLREKDGHLMFSAVGDSLDISKALFAVGNLDRNVPLEAYVDLKNMMLSSAHSVKNVKGHFSIVNGKIVDGACYAVFGEDSTIAMNAKDIPNSDDYLLSLSASNAGKFLKYLKISDTVIGGSIKFIVKSSKNSEQSLSGVFELNDSIVKNNSQLIKLVSLSSTSWLPNTDNLAIGFSSCIGNFIMADNQIKIENGRAIGPTFAISFNGTYDRLNDEFNLFGISVPMSSIVNTQNSSGSLAANFSMTGPLGAPLLSVKPLKFVSSDILNQTFGNMLPVGPSFASSEDEIGPSASPSDSRDPFGHGAFDKRSSSSLGKGYDAGGGSARYHKVDKKFGVTINRGASRQK